MRDLRLHQIGSVQQNAGQLVPDAGFQLNLRVKSTDTNQLLICYPKINIVDEIKIKYIVLCKK